MASRLRFLRPVAPAPVQIDMQKLVYDLVVERANAMFGPGSSFTVSIRQDDDPGTSMFSETVIETLAWDVSRGIEEAEFRAKLAG